MANDMRSLIGELKQQGWTVVDLGGNRYRAKPPGTVGIPAEFSSHIDHNPQGFLNVIRTLKKGGFQWPPVEAKRRRILAGGTQTLTAAPGEAKLFPTAPPPAVAAASTPVEAAAPPAAKAAAPEDDAIHRLKEARDYLKLADDELERQAIVVGEAEAKLAELRGAYQGAKAQRREALEELREARKAFLAAFDGDGDDGDDE